jgi:predicted CoA-binding protein
MGKIVLIGASPNPLRYSYKAVVELVRQEFEVIPLGKRENSIGNIHIMTGKPDIKDVDLVILYINKVHQEEYYDYILRLNPKKILFNPGTENPELVQIAYNSGIEILYDCALVLLYSKRFGSL